MKIDKRTESSVIYNIKRLEIEVDKLANNILKPYDMTHTQFKILMLLLRDVNDSVKQIDLERHFNLSNPTVTGVLKNLEKKDLIYREINPQDIRSKFVLLTARTRQMKDTLEGLAKEIDKGVTSALSDLEKTQLLTLLDKMLLEIKKEREL